MSDPEPSLPATPPPPPAVRGGRWGAALVAVLVVLFVVLISVHGAGRTLRDPPATVSAAITFLPYFYAAFVSLAFGVWTLVPDRRTPPALLAVTTMIGVVTWVPGWAGRGVSPEGAPIRVMEWNLRRLWGTPSTDDPTACAAAAIEREDPDVLVLLELSADELAHLQAATPMSCIQADYLGTGDARHGGLAVCARGDVWSLRWGSPKRYLDDDPWRFVIAEAADGDRVLNVIAVHLVPYRFAASELRTGVRDLATGDPDDLLALGRRGEATARAQGAQAAVLRSRLEQLTHPTVIAGDFNSTRDAALHTALRAHLHDAFEQAGTGFGPTIRFLDVVPLRVDFVYTTDDVVPVDARVLDDRCSDHQAVVVDVDLR